jgi:hypothetical protein
LDQFQVHVGFVSEYFLGFDKSVTEDLLFGFLSDYAELCGFEQFDKLLDEGLWGDFGGETVVKNLFADVSVCAKV